MIDMNNFISPKRLLEMKQDVVEETLSLAYPIIALQYNNGIMMMGQNPSKSLHKTSEIYDRVAFAGTGVFNDYERLRKSGVHMADVKGFQYSRKDVKAKFIASEYSTVLGDIFVRQPVPMEVEIMLVELGESQEEDRMYFIPFSGGLVEERNVAIIGDFVRLEKGISKGRMRRYLHTKDPSPEMELSEAVKLVKETMEEVRKQGDLTAETIELVTLDRTLDRERKFKRFENGEIAELI